MDDSRLVSADNQEDCSDIIVLSALKQQNCHLAEVEVDEVFCLMSHIASKISTNDAVPGRVVLFVEFLLDECSNVFFDIELFQGLGSTVYGILLHILGHIGILDY